MSGTYIFCHGCFYGHFRPLTHVYLHIYFALDTTSLFNNIRSFYRHLLRFFKVSKRRLQRGSLGHDADPERVTSLTFRRALSRVAFTCIVAQHRDRKRRSQLTQPSSFIQPHLTPHQVRLRQNTLLPLSTTLTSSYSS